MDKEKSQSDADIHERILIVQNELGIHARPAAMIVRIANKYDANVNVEKEDEQVNGKSIMGLMMLGAGPGSIIVVRAAGEDASVALDSLSALVIDGFNED